MPELSPRDFAADMLGMKALESHEELPGGEDIDGFTALAPQPGGAPSRRVAVLYFGSFAYIFEGRTANPGLAGLYDSMFLSTIKSFRPMTGQDRDAVLGIRIHYMKAPVGMTFAKLAETSPVKPYPEETLRLINGYYPRGEPEPGEWIKVFR